jgi:hypothetical protein
LVSPWEGVKTIVCSDSAIFSALFFMEIDGVGSTVGLLGLHPFILWAAI